MKGGHCSHCSPSVMFRVSAGGCCWWLPAAVGSSFFSCVLWSLPSSLLINQAYTGPLLFSSASLLELRTQTQPWQPHPAFASKPIPALRHTATHSSPSLKTIPGRGLLQEGPGCRKTAYLTQSTSRDTPDANLSNMTRNRRRSQGPCPTQEFSTAPQFESLSFSAFGPLHDSLFI